MNILEIIAAKDKGATLASVLRSSGGDPSELKTALERNSNFISTCIMAKYISKRHTEEFHALNHEQQLIVCVNLFNEAMEEFINESPSVGE